MYGSTPSHTSATPRALGATSTRAGWQMMTEGSLAGESQSNWRSVKGGALYTEPSKRTPAWAGMTYKLGSQLALRPNAAGGHTCIMRSSELRGSCGDAAPPNARSNGQLATPFARASANTGNSSASEIARAT